MAKKKILAFIIPLFICAVLLMVVIIAIAIWFQKMRKKIEAEIGEADKKRDKVSKMTVKPRKRENKYSKSKKRKEDLEPGFYESPPMRDEQREILEMKRLQNHEGNAKDCLPMTRDQLAQLAASRQFSSHAVTIPRALGGGDDQNSKRMTTFQVVPELPQKSKSHAATMSRTFERDYMDGNANRHVFSQTRIANHPSRGATLPVQTFSPNKKDYEPGSTSRFRDTVTQQQLSRNTNYTSTNVHDGQEMYENMGHTIDEVYENTGYVDDENIYGNQEMIDKENRRSSQHNTEQLSEYSRNWNSQVTRYQENDADEEVYENQEIVEQERRRSSNTHYIELYGNYVAEETYENC